MTGVTNPAATREEVEEAQRSMIATRKPLRCDCQATAAPASPHPTIATSTSFNLLPTARLGNEELCLGNAVQPQNENNLEDNVPFKARMANRHFRILAVEGRTNHRISIADRRHEAISGIGIPCRRSGFHYLSVAHSPTEWSRAASRF